MANKDNDFKRVLSALSIKNKIDVHVTHETSLNDKLRSVGVNPERLLSFLRECSLEKREKLEYLKDSTNIEEYYSEKLILNEIDVLICYIDSSL